LTGRATHRHIPPPTHPCTHLEGAVCLRQLGPEASHLRLQPACHVLRLPQAQRTARLRRARRLRCALRTLQVFVPADSRRRRGMSRRSPGREGEHGSTIWPPLGKQHNLAAASTTWPPLMEVGYACRPRSSLSTQAEGTRALQECLLVLPPPPVALSALQLRLPLVGGRQVSLQLGRRFLHGTARSHGLLVAALDARKLARQAADLRGPTHGGGGGSQHGCVGANMELAVASMDVWRPIWI